MHVGSPRSHIPGWNPEFPSSADECLHILYFHIVTTSSQNEASVPQPGAGLVRALHLASAVYCLLLSTLYHTGLNHSPSVAHRWLQFDYGGILALILGNFISGLHFGFYCDPVLKMLYWSMVSPIGRHCISLKKQGLNLTVWIDCCS